MKKYFPLIIFLIFVLIFFNDIFFTSLTYFERDITGMFYPFSQFAKEEILKGNIPLWNPYINCGAPFLANMQSGVFYPLNIVFYFFNFVPAFKIYIFLSFYLSLVFMYFLLKDFGLKSLESIAGAVVWTFSGTMITRIEFFSVLGTTIWLPLSFLFLRKLINKSVNYFSFKYLSLFSIVLTVQFFAGHPQEFAYSIFLLLMYTLFELIIRKKLTVLYCFLSGILLSILLSSIQLLPSIEWILNSRRMSTGDKLGMGYEDATIECYKPHYLRNVIYPLTDDVLRTRNRKHYSIEFLWMRLHYTGIFGFILAVTGFLVNKKKYKYLFIFIIFTSTILAFGKYLPFYRTLYDLFLPLRLIRFPGKIMYLSIFALSVMSAFGMEEIRKKYLKILLIFGIFFELFFYKDYILISLPESIFKEKGPVTKYLINNNNLHRFMLTPLTIRNQVIRGLNLYNSISNFNDRLYGNLNMVYKIYNFYGQDTEIKYYREYLERTFSKSSIDEAHKLISIANIKYIISVKQIDSKKFKFLLGGQTFLYENEFYLPRFFAVNKYVFVERKRALDYIEGPKFNPMEEVVLSEISSKKRSLPKYKSFKKDKIYIKIIEYLPGKSKFKIYSKNSAFFVLLDTYYPGWKAYINGIETEIYNANYLFKAVLIPPGNSIIEFVYKPVTFEIGVFLTFIIMIFILFINLYKNK